MVCFNTYFKRDLHACPLYGVEMTSGGICVCVLYLLVLKSQMRGVFTSLIFSELWYPKECEVLKAAGKFSSILEQLLCHISCGSQFVGIFLLFFTKLDCLKRFKRMVFEEENRFTKAIFKKHLIWAHHSLGIINKYILFSKETSLLKLICFYVFPIPAYSIFFPLLLLTCWKLRNQITNLDRIAWRRVRLVASD